MTKKQKEAERMRRWRAKYEETYLNTIVLVKDNNSNVLSVDITIKQAFTRIKTKNPPHIYARDIRVSVSF